MSETMDRRAGSRGVLGRRRAIFAGLVLGSSGAALTALAAILAGDGIGLGDVLMLVCFGLTLPWTMIGLWNAVIGLCLAGRATEGLVDGGSPGSRPAVPSRTAVLIAVHDEDAVQIRRHVEAMAGDLLADPGIDDPGGRFEFFVLSDSRNADVLARERALFAGGQGTIDGGNGRGIRWTYRRRTENTDHKSGNLWDFLERHGDRFAHFILLDADSLMSGALIERLARTMEARPELGILQPLIVGLPNASPFARIFQYGMRHGMRAYATGGDWWQGDAGPFWGHNAIVRTEAFMAACRLPRLPGGPPLGGLVLSHDQIEAALMRAGGHEVRVLPVEDGSFEENPPTLQDFIKRDLRWCQGNMQYLRLLRMQGLRPMGRLQLVLAILMYAAAPAWLLFVMAGLTQGLLLGAEDTAGLTPLGWSLGIGLLAIMMTINLTPKLAGITGVLLNARRRAAYGGAGRILVSALIETVFALFLGPIMAVAQTIFIGGLLSGRTIGWEAQRRVAHELAWREAWAGLWPQTLVGLGMVLALAAGAPALLPWVLPIAVPLTLAVPFAWLTSRRRLGDLLISLRICATPEELDGQHLSYLRRHAPSVLAADAPAGKDQALAPSP